MLSGYPDILSYDPEWVILRVFEIFFIQFQHPNIEIPAFVPQGGASRRQAKQFQNSNPFVSVICILKIRTCFGFGASDFGFHLLPIYFPRYINLAIHDLSGCPSDRATDDSNLAFFFPCFYSHIHLA
jgi:hypothetical protein